MDQAGLCTPLIFCLRPQVDLFVQMGLGAMDVYREGFETQFLASSASYYSRMVAEAAPTSEVPDYLRMCDHQLSLETTRVANYLHPETEGKLVKVVKKELLEVPQEELMCKLDSGLVVVFGASLPFADVDREVVKLLYRLYKDLPTGLPDERLEGVKSGKPAITVMLKEHIISLGKAEVAAQVGKEDGKEGSTSGKEFIERLVAIHKHFVTLFDEDCEADKDFHAVLKEAYQKHIINDSELGDPHFIPRLLSEFCDFYLNKDNAKSISIDDAQASLDSAVQMYSYLEDKDYFNQHYKRSLANRLLHDSTVGTDQEDQFLMMIKQRCGAMWTKHQEAMINDINKSDGLHKSQFEGFRAEAGSGCEDFAGIDVSVRMLNERMWPAMREDQLQAPRALQQIIDGFNLYYEQSQAKSAADGPKIQLNWLLTQGNATVKPVYGGAKKGFGHKAFNRFKFQLANPYQLAILLLFNERDEWTGPELEAQLNMDAATLAPYLDSLARPKIKALTAKSGVPDVSVKDAQFSQLVFSVNAKLPQQAVKKGKALPKLRFAMPKKDVAKEVEKLDLAIQEERRFAIQAALVRTMKASKTMKVATLVPDVCKSLSGLFQAHPPFVRKQMEELIDQGYMERDEDNPQELRYIA
jgi:cullin 1